MRTRRCFIRSLIHIAIAITLPLRLQATDTTTAGRSSYRFQWRVPKVHKDTVENKLQFEGEVVEEKDSKGIGVFIFIGLVLLPYLAKAILALHREMEHGGVVIDTRSKEIQIDSDKSLPGGVIIIVSKEGTQLYERNEIGNPEELINALKSL